MEFNKKNVRAIMILIAFTALLWLIATHLSFAMDAVVYIINVSKSVIAGLCIAFVLNVLLYPIENSWLRFMGNSKHKFVRKMRRPVAIFITLLLFLGFITAVIIFIIPDLSVTVTTLINNIPLYITKAVNWLEGLTDKFNFGSDFFPSISIDWDNLFETINKYLSDGGSTEIINKATTITSSLLAGIVNAIFSFILAIYVLSSKEKISAFMKKLLKAYLREKTYTKLINVLTISYDRFSNFIRYQCLEALILGVLCFIGMSIFAFPYALVISVIITLTALVPVVGPLIGEVLGMLIIFTVSPLKGIFFLIFILALQQFETTIIYPKVVGHSVGLPGVIVLSAVLIGGNVGGVFGALVATPLSAVIYVLLKNGIDKRLERKKKPEPITDLKK